MKKNLFGVLALVAVSLLASCNAGGAAPTGPGADVPVKVLGNKGWIVTAKNTSGATWDAATASQQIDQLLSGPDGQKIDVILSNNDGMAVAVAASDVFKQSKALIAGIDALKDALEQVKTNDQYIGSIRNDGNLQAKVLMDVMYRMNKGEKPEEMTTVAGLKVVKTKDEWNADPDSIWYDSSATTPTKAFRAHHVMITKENIDKYYKDGQPVASNKANVTDDRSGANAQGKLFALTYNNSDPNMSSLWNPGFKDNYKQYGFNDFAWNDAANKDEQALNFIDQAAKETSYAGFAVNVVSQTNGNTYLEKLKTTGKPVIFWNRELSKSDGSLDTATMGSYDKAYYVGIESAEGGRYEGQMMAEYIKSHGGIEKFDRNKDGRIGFAVILGEQMHADAEARTTWAPIYLNAYLQDNPDEVLKKFTPATGKYGAESWPSSFLTTVPYQAPETNK